MKRISEIFITVCFLGFLTAGLVFTVLRQPEDYSYYENRMLASFPALSAQSAGDGSFAAGAERYLNDHAPLRTTMLISQVRWI